jgi:flagellar protein FlaG
MTTQVDPASNPEPSTAELQRIAEELQRRVHATAPELRFTVDQSSGRSVIQVTDPATNEVIQQIPSEEALHINQALDRFQQGLLLNRKA